MLAEVTAREIGRVTIAEALELTALVARKQPHRYGRFAACWLCLYLEEHELATLEDVALLVLSVEFRSTRMDLSTCTMRGIKTVRARFTPSYIPGCPCRSNVKNRVLVVDIADLVLHEVWAQIAWDWNGVSVWNFACLGGKKVDAITGQWYLANAGAQYCPERPDSLHVRDRMDNQVFKYPANGFFCFMGTTTVTYRNVYVTGGKTGDVTTGQIVNIDEPVLCPPLAVQHETIRVSG